MTTALETPISIEPKKEHPMTIDYTTSGPLANDIRAWATEIAAPSIDVETVVIEALNEAEARADGESINYELRARETRTGRPEVFTVSNPDNYA